MTILLVDDDPFQASIRKSILERKFSDVRRVRNAAEALCLIEQPQFAGKLALVVSGHQHSGIGVQDFVAELQSRMPLVPVLVLDDNSDPNECLLGESVRFLHRPLIAEEMLDAASQLVKSRGHISPLAAAASY